ncbi:MAG: hypothetical protein JWR22_2654 [Herminiimonas sp.]|nr:hypothetical protein [Herminiimonas sp.]
MPVNVTNSKFASFAKLESGFREMGHRLELSPTKHEVRARKEGNLIVFYVRPRGNLVQRKLEDIFSGRQGKLNAARECVQTMLERHVPRSDRHSLMAHIRADNNSVGSIHTAVVAAYDAEPPKPSDFLKSITDGAETAGPTACRQVGSAMLAMFRDSSALSDSCKIDMVRTMNQGTGQAPTADGSGVKASHPRPWDKLEIKEQDRLRPTLEAAMQKAQSMGIDEWIQKLADPISNGSAFSRLGKKLIDLCKEDLQISVEGNQS